MTRKQSYEGLGGEPPKENVQLMQKFWGTVWSQNTQRRDWQKINGRGKVIRKYWFHSKHDRKLFWEFEVDEWCELFYAVGGGGVWRWWIPMLKRMKSAQATLSLPLSVTKSTPKSQLGRVESKTQKVWDKSKFWPGSELCFPSLPWPDPKGSLELRVLRWPSLARCWDPRGVCQGHQQESQKLHFLAWPMGSLPVQPVGSSIHRQYREGTGLHGWVPLSGPGVSILQAIVSASITSSLLPVLLANQSHRRFNTGKSHLPLAGTQEGDLQ